MRERHAPIQAPLDGLSVAERRRFLNGKCLYAIVTQAQASRPLEELIARLLEGGAAVVQLREKQLCDSELVAQARGMGALFRRARVPLLLNDRPDLVPAARASGVHVGRGDPSPAEARHLLGPDAIIGATAHSLAEALAAQKSGADYLGVGPVFASGTKQVSPPRGLDWLASIVRSVRIPCIAIGGVRIENVDAVARAGAHGVAVCEALLRADDPASAAREICARLSAGPEGAG